MDRIKKIAGRPDKTAWWQPAIMLFLKLSVWISVPVLAGIFAGKWLDRRYGTEPWLFLICVGAAFVISMFGLVRNASREIKKFNNNSNNNSKK